MLLLLAVLCDFHSLLNPADYTQAVSATEGDCYFDGPLTPSWEERKSTILAEEYVLICQLRTKSLFPITDSPKFLIKK